MRLLTSKLGTGGRLDTLIGHREPTFCAAGPRVSLNLTVPLPRLLIEDPGYVAFMAGTLDSVSDANKPMSEREYYRLGRLFFDGADAEWIAAREQISQAEVQTAWEYCREKLSSFFAAAAGEELRLLSDTELCARSEDCVRLLLHWYEVLSENERWSQAALEKRSKADAVDEEEPQ